MENQHTQTCDVAVVGGGAAGLGAAVTLARSLRSVVVIDAGQPRNAPAAGAHNLLGREGVNPLELLATGRAEAESYGAEVRRDDVAGVRREGDGFVLTLVSGTTLRARRLLLATGLVDELPDVPGLREQWGNGVVHCPYCHGYEHRGERIGVLGSGPMSVHQVLLFRQLSPDVTLFLHAMDDLEDEQWDQLAALGISVVTGEVSRVVSEGDRLTGVELDDGHVFAIDALAVAPRFVARGALYEELGGTLVDHPMGGRVVPTQPMGVTDLPGVYAAGNVADLSAMVGASAAAGVGAGAMINAELVMADARAAVEEAV